MLLDVSLGAEQALLLSSPKRDADGAARFDVERLQDAHCFHRHHGARSVVGRAGPCDPAIEMTAQHDNLIFQLGIGARNFSNGVESVLVFPSEFGFDVDLHAHGRMGLREPVETAVAFDGCNHHRIFTRWSATYWSAAKKSRRCRQKGFHRSRRHSSRRGWVR